jgi:hypothetical protein
MEISSSSCLSLLFACFYKGWVFFPTIASPLALAAVIGAAAAEQGVAVTAVVVTAVAVKAAAAEPGTAGDDWSHGPLLGIRTHQ